MYRTSRIVLRAARRTARIVLIVLSLAGVSLAASTPEVFALPHDVDVLFAMANEARVSHGLAPLTRSTHLHSDARAWTLKMAESHDLQDPPVYCAGGANVGVTSRWQAHPAKKLARAFMRSPEHRHNILLPYVSEVGIAVVRRGGLVWTTEIFCA